MKQAQTLGFTLEDIEQLLGLAAGAPESCRAVRALPSAKIEELNRKIAMLRAMRSALTRLVATCSPAGDRECPLLARLERAVA